MVGRRAVVVVGVLALAATALAGCELFPGSPDFVVTTTTDGADADPGDGTCEVTVGAHDCSLRAAITEANASTVVSSVTVPSGTYALTLPGADDTNAGGDLDLAPVAGSMVLVNDGSDGFAIDATGADGGIDLHSGNLAAFGVGVSGATGDGVTIRGNALGAFSLSSIHDNGGAGVGVGPTARAQLWTTTISGNGAGGVANQGRTTTKFVTVVNNTGGGFTGRGNDGPNNGIVLDSSIVAQQASGLSCADGVLSTSFTLAGADGTCGVGVASVTTSDPVVDPLTGGLVPHHPLTYPTSYGRDSIPVGSGSCVPGSSLMQDQRGVARPVGGACDRGAYEGPEPISITVDSAMDQPDADPGDGVCESATLSCTLRAAIDESNAWPGVDTITFGVNVYPTLTIDGSGEDLNATGDLDVTDAVTLVGDGTRIGSIVPDRLFDLHGDPFTRTFEDLVLWGGDASADARGGGAIWSEGPLALVQVTIEGTKGSTYGAIENVGGSYQRGLTLTDVRVTGTTGSIAAVRSEIATLERTTIDSSIGSGGMSMYAGRVTDSSFLDNEGSGLLATTQVAGSFESDLDIFRSTFAGNTATDAGGGIHVFPGVGVYLNDSTVSGNTAPVGAAIFTEPVGSSGLWNGTASILSSTIAANQGPTSLAGSIGLGNSAVDGGSGVACGGPAGSATYGGTVVTDASCVLPAVENPVVADLELGPLANNGGPTLTHLPEPTSPVVDAIAPDAGAGRCVGTITDQRGVARPQGLGCDAGSVETEAANDGDLTVDTAVDAVDLDPGDGLCVTANGDCSLRAAIEESNASALVEVIEIAPGIDPTLSIAGRGEDANVTGDLDITAPVAIHGGGATIDGAGIDRLLDTRSTVGIVSLEDLTLQGGDGTSGPGAGPGAIAAAGGLRLTEVAIVDNAGTGAGAVSVTATNVMDENNRTALTDSEVARNTGGPAVVQAGGRLDVTGTDVHDNTGGGLSIVGRDLTMDASTIRGNAGTSGAGAYAEVLGATYVTDSWIDGNIATGNGGGLAVLGYLDVTSSTFSANSAANGGGIYTTGSFQMKNSTVTGNSSLAGGAGITSGSVFITLSTIAANSGPTSLVAAGGTIFSTIVVPGSGVACNGAILNRDFNLFGDTTCGTGGTNVVGTPVFGPLQDNGGATPTRLLQAGSAGRDAIPTSATIPTGFGFDVPACPFFVTGIDQRGVNRPQSGACDIGSTEQ